MSRWPWLPSAVAGLGFALWWLGGAIVDPTVLAAGSVYSEAPGHLWALWGASEGLATHGPFVREVAAAHPRGLRMHMMDAVNLAVFWPALRLCGPVVAWNILHAVWPLVGALGVYQLARRVAGTGPALPWAALLGVVVTLGNPFFLLYGQQGRTEYLPALLYPLHLALLHRWLRRDEHDGVASGRPPTWVGVGAGLSLGAVALGGWYLAAFAAILDVAVGLAWSRGVPVAERAMRLALPGTVALACLVPAARALVHQEGSEWLLSPGTSTSMASPDPLLAAFRLADPATTGMMDSQPYLGVLALALGALGAWWTRRWSWLAVAMLALVLAHGTTLSLGFLDGASLPAAWLVELCPPLAYVRTWSRVLSLGAALAGGAAMIGVVALWSRLGRWGVSAILVLSALCLVDQGTWPERATPSSFEARAPRAAHDALATMAPGGVLTLPIDRSLRLPDGREEHALWLVWQLDLGRPVSASFMGTADNLAGLALVEAAAEAQAACVASRRDACLGKDLREAWTLSASTSTLARVRAEAAALWSAGYGGVLLAEDREAGGALRALLVAVMGGPQFDREGIVAWNLRDVAGWAREAPRTVARVRDDTETATVALSTRGTRKPGRGGR
ncbi:MAG: hypothetical protein FJ090_01880 [Deltaproteobacteria bacterium]|nr:hypothetical protein [Deltaproteobacteria bacterium]